MWTFFLSFVTMIDNVTMMKMSSAVSLGEEIIHLISLYIVYSDYLMLFCATIPTVICHFGLTRTLVELEARKNFKLVLSFSVNGDILA